MNKKLILIFAILTVLPVAFLIWFAKISMEQQKDQSQQRFAALIEERLLLYQDEILSVFSDIESELLIADVTEVKKALEEAGSEIHPATAGEIGLMERPSTPSKEVLQALRDLDGSNQTIRQVFFISVTGEMLYPSLEYDLSSRERAFVERTRDIGLSRGLFLSIDKEDKLILPDDGWHSWYMNDGLNFIFWRKLISSDGGEHILGFELNRLAVIAAVIAALPDTQIVSDDEYNIVLSALGSGILYQWGSPGIVSTESVVSSVRLPPPLMSWQLEYYGEVPKDWENGQSFSLVVSLIAGILVILGLSVYLYRESTRELRTASKRVTFVNQVSHELKTPLTNIRMYAELLEGRIPETEDRSREYLGVVISESQRLSRLINNVLTFGRQQKATLQFSPIQARVDDCIRAVLESFAPVLKSKGFVIELDLNADNTVFIDSDMVEQIISNLVSNTEKYAARGRYLKISSFQKDDFIVIQVLDHGPGIPKNQRQKIFRSFYRISDRLSDGAAGTGIGLSIVKTLAIIHGGDVEVQDSEEGALFVVKIRTPGASGLFEQQEEYEA